VQFLLLFFPFYLLKEVIAIHCSLLLTLVFPPSFCGSSQIITVRSVTDFQFLLFVAQTLCLGLHALELAGLGVFAFGKDWGAFLTALVGSLVHPVAYGYTGHSFGPHPTRFISLRQN